MVATDHNLKIHSSALEYCVVVTSGTDLGPLSSSSATFGFILGISYPTQ